MTELRPAAGPHASITPAKFAAKQGTVGMFAFESRYLEGQRRQAVLIDSKQSQLNRMEAALQQAIDDGHPLLTRLPRILVTYDRDGTVEEYSDISLPHRAFDGHIRAGSIDGSPAVRNETYRAARDSTPANARPLFDLSPATIIFGGWDATRKSRQWRGRSALVGEIIGFCSESDEAHPPKRGGARVDPVGMHIYLNQDGMKDLVADQANELSEDLQKKATAKSGKPSRLGLGGIPPGLDSLGGIACDRIIRSHVLSFAALRQMRFGSGVKGDAACRALLAALGLNALAKSDAELCLRANCDLVEAAPSRVTIDRRAGSSDNLRALTVQQADALLGDALRHAEEVAAVSWQGPVLKVVGNPKIVAAAVDDEASED
ncbi:MAG: type I-U CRISPR-associated RAMP protein Csb1/Cas7u [Candidatus Nanopelagicales bacterium]|nr:type I-U CRISPR-associated RAMP protein Csb1/Cas7u [Candidatus Nanopelagicales bacterium]